MGFFLGCDEQSLLLDKISKVAVKARKRYT